VEIISMKAYSKEELLEKYKLKHGNKYDYATLDICNKINGKVTIICPIHGKFLQHHYDHLSAGCPKCGLQRKKEKSSKILIQDIEDLKLKCFKKFGDKFDFLSSVFYNTGSRLTVLCKVHNTVFNNTAYHIIRGQGCPLCKKDKISNKKRLGTDEFVKRSKIIHNDRYDYSLVDYKTLINQVEIICKEHGVFKQAPRDHIQGSGCKLCAGTSVSPISQQWLDSFDIEFMREHEIRYDVGYFVVDGYDPKTNTIYEFYGDYWHGNPNIFDSKMINSSVDLSFGTLYNNTIKREEILKNLGFKLVTIWENEFNDKKII